MRLAVWNCNERFDRNYLHLRDLDFDVAVVTECGPFEPALGELRAVSSVLKLAVEQPRHTKHIGVFAQEPWRVEPLPPVTSQPWLLPARVTGPVEFTILAVWALGPEWVKGRLSDAQQTARVIAELLPSIEGPVVLAGDLNAPIASNPADARQHADSVSRLMAHGLVSAFAAARGDADPLTEPTLYHQWKADKPFHIDHAFVPKEWTGGIELTVGTYAAWVATKRSDHVPIIIDLPLSAPQASIFSAARLMMWTASWSRRSAEASRSRSTSGWASEKTEARPCGRDTTRPQSLRQASAWRRCSA